MSAVRRIALGARKGLRFVIFMGILWLSSIAIWMFGPWVFLDGASGKGVIALLFPIIIPPLLVYGLYDIGKNDEASRPD